MRGDIVDILATSSVGDNTKSTMSHNENLPVKSSSSIQHSTLSPIEVADSILMVFKQSIKQAGSLAEAEYQMMYRKTEDQLKHYLSHLIELTEGQK